MKLSISIRNGTDQDLHIITEPWLDEVMLEPEGVAELSGQFGQGLEGIEIEYQSDNSLILFVPSEAEFRKK